MARNPLAFGPAEVVRDVANTFVKTSAGRCSGCPLTETALNVDGRCIYCAIAFVAKIRSIAVIATPWALKHVREQGWTDR